MKPKKHSFLVKKLFRVSVLTGCMISFLIYLLVFFNSCLQDPEDPRQYKIRDEVPLELHSFEKNLQARPLWGKEIPQFWNRHILFAQQPPIQKDRLKNVLLLCQIRAPGFDPFGRPDLQTLLTLPNGKEITINSPDNKSRVTLSIPGVSLQTGDTFHLKVYDRDDNRDDFVGETTFDFLGTLPLTKEEQEMSIECRAIERDSIERELPKWILKAKQELRLAPKSITSNIVDAYAGMKNDEHSFTPFETCKFHVEQMAALVGWADPRVQKRVAQIELLNTQWKEKLITAWKKKYQTLPLAGTKFSLPSLSLNLRVLEVTKTTQTAESVRYSLLKKHPIQALKKLESSPWTQESQTSENYLVTLELQNTGEQTVSFNENSKGMKVFLILPDFRHLALVPLPRLENSRIQHEIILAKGTTKIVQFLNKIPASQKGELAEGREKGLGLENQFTYKQIRLQ